MDKEKLIYDAILEKAHGVNRTTRQVYGQGQYDMAYEILNMVDEIINTEPKNNGWIPCSERLPDKEDLYQVTIRYENYAGVYEITRMAQFDKTRGWEIYGARPVILYEIIKAWQPLPQPYKGE